MQITQLEAVVAITETGSFRKAADRLGRSQPTLTKNVRALEDSVNVIIFQRTPRGVRLTESGERFYKRALTVLADIQALEDEVAQMAGHDGGQVRIGVSPVGGTVIMPRALRLFRKKWPRVEVDLVSVMYPESTNLLREAALDLAIGPVPTFDTHGTFIVEPLFNMDVLIATHESNPGRNATSLSDLIDEKWIIHGSKEGPSSLYAGTFSDRTLPPAYTRCHSLSATVAMIAETNAFCVFSRHLFDTVAPSHGIVQVPIEDVLPKFHLSLVLQKSRPLTPAAADMAQFIRRRATTLVHSGAVSDSHME